MVVNDNTTTDNKMSPQKVEQQHHPLSWPSWVLVQMLNVNCFVVHWVCQLLAPSLEPLVSTFMIGGLFGLCIPPLLTLVMMTRFVPFGNTFFCAFGVWYFVSCVFDKSPLRPTGRGPAKARNFFERCVEKFWASSFDYNPTTLRVLEKTDALLKSQRQFILFAVHPHGVHCWPLNLLCFRGSPFAKRYPHFECAGLCASVMFFLPVIREAFLNLGYFDAARPVAEKALEKSNLFVCTGGEKEAMLTKPGIDYVVLRHRKGFVRLALKKNAALVPVFGFGNNDLYHTYDFLTNFRNYLQTTFAIALPIFHGRLGTPLPYKVPLHVVIGDPIPLPARPTSATTEEWPTPQIIDKVHHDYIQALKHLHATYAPPGRQLQII